MRLKVSTAPINRANPAEPIKGEYAGAKYNRERYTTGNKKLYSSIYSSLP